MSEGQGLAVDDSHTSPTSDLTLRNIYHGVNCAHRYFPSPHPIGCQYDITSCPLFLDVVCSIHILSTL
jgi:hypothetical protein